MFSTRLHYASRDLWCRSDTKQILPRFQICEVIYTKFDILQRQCHPIRATSRAYSLYYFIFVRTGLVSVRQYFDPMSLSDGDTRSLRIGDLIFVLFYICTDRARLCPPIFWSDKPLGRSYTPRFSSGTYSLYYFIFVRTGLVSVRQHFDPINPLDRIFFSQIPRSPFPAPCPRLW